MYPVSPVILSLRLFVVAVEDMVTVEVVEGEMLEVDMEQRGGNGGLLIHLVEVEMEVAQEVYHLDGRDGPLIHLAMETQDQAAILLKQEEIMQGLEEALVVDASLFLASSVKLFRTANVGLSLVNSVAL